MLTLDNLFISIYNISMFYRNPDIPYAEMVKSVEDYFRTPQSLRKIASVHGVSHKTLWLWVIVYKQEGKAGLRKRWLNKKRLSRNIEEKVMFLKEQNPSLSINKTRQLLNNEGIKISNKGVWSIWKRYGLANRIERRKRDPLDIFVEPTPESEYWIEKAKELVEKEDYRKAAKILNRIPCLPECKLLKKIPEKFLSLRRRFELLYLNFGEIPHSQFLREINRIEKSLEKKGYIYSSIIANFLELNTLGWIGKLEEKVKVLNQLAKKMNGFKNSSLQFLFYFEQASTHSGLLQTDMALNAIKKCRRMVYRLPYPYYWECFGDILTNVGKYKNAFLFYRMAFENNKDKAAIERLALKMAIFGYSMSGEYSACNKLLGKAQSLRNSTSFGTTYFLINAYLSLGKGNLTDASQFFVESLEKAQKGTLLNRIYAASLGLATVAMALNKKSEKRIYLQKYLPLVKKHKLAPEKLILSSLIKSAGNIPAENRHIPPLYLLYLLLQANKTMKIGDYRKAFNFARKQGLLGAFHRWIVFFPEPILHLLEKGKQTGLPRVILKFPIFNQKTSVFHIKFLGRLVVLKTQQYLKTKLSPKEKAFLIYLALKANEPGKIIPLIDLFSNFWQKNKNPSSLFSHFLVRIKKKLKIPTHLIEITTRYPGRVLINHGIYFTTDYNDFKIATTHARALERAGEWGFAKKEYLRAFNLFRNEPFKKMYDNWSEEMRRVILNKLECDVINFAKSCVEHGNPPNRAAEPKSVADAKRVLEKVSRIIPDSEEITNRLKGLS